MRRVGRDELLRAAHPAKRVAGHRHQRGTFGLGSDRREVRIPDHGVDALGDTARNPAAQDLVARVVTRYTPTSVRALRPCDTHLMASAGNGNTRRSAATSASAKPPACAVTRDE